MNPKRLTEEQEEALYQEYSQWLANKPKELCKRYGLPRSTLKGYVRRIRERMAA